MTKTELNDVRLFLDGDRRIGSPAVARRLLDFKHVTNRKDGSVLYLTAHSQAAAARLQIFAAKHGVTLWREPRRRRQPRVASEVNDTCIARFIDESGLREGTKLSARALISDGAVLCSERRYDGGGRTMRLAVSGAMWTLQTKCPGDRATAPMTFNWHGDDEHDEREDVQARVLRLYARTVKSLTKRWGEPEPIDDDEVTEWRFPRASLRLHLQLSDMFAGIDVHVA